MIFGSLGLAASNGQYLKSPNQINAENAIVEASMVNIDAEYAALVADYSLVTV